MAEPRLSKEKHRQMLSFYLGKELFGIEISFVAQVIEVPALSFVPRAPFFLRGAVNYRGKVIAVIDLADFLGMGKKELNFEHRIVILDSKEHHLGFLVEKVGRIETIAEKGVAVAQRQGNYLREVVNLGGRIFNVIDLEKLLSEIENYFS